MSPNPQWKRLVEALDSELSLLARLRNHADAGQDPLVRLDVPAVETWSLKQAELLDDLAAAGAERAENQEACLPTPARGISGSGRLARAVTLHALAAAAPAFCAQQLRQQRDALRQLRDEIAVLSRRNEVLIAQVLEFTQHLGQGLVTQTRNPGYDASGQASAQASSGELFRRSI